jgi:hypothetical protein
MIIERSDMREFVAAHQAKFPQGGGMPAEGQEGAVGLLRLPRRILGIPSSTSNPIKSTFTTVRLRTYKTEGSGSRMAFLAMAVKLVESAQNNWRKTEL